jgi:hypothetical protein
MFEVQAQSPTASICSIDAIQPDVPRLEDGNSEAFPAIMCSDYPVINFTPDNFAEFARGLTNISKAAGDVNALFRLACVGRKVRPKWRFDGMPESILTESFHPGSDVKLNIALIVK